MVAKGTAHRRRRLVLLLAGLLAVPGASSFAIPGHVSRARVPRRRLAMASPAQAAEVVWEPQDLTRDVPGCLPIPEDDYVKQVPVYGGKRACALDPRLRVTPTRPAVA